MKLSAYTTNNYQELRDLNEEEMSNHRKYTPIFVEARNRLRLFRMLKINYDDWQQYIHSLLSVKTSDHDTEMLNLDRLLLNYLTCAYTIQKHFEVSFQSRFRKNEEKKKEFADFNSKLFKASWAFAFFMDYRGYVQHYGLGIGNYSRNVTQTSVTLNITCTAASLLKDGKAWEKSHLKPERGELDIVDLLHEFHVQMFQSYGAFVAKLFFPELTEAAVFYSNLTQEVTFKYPSMRMVFAGETKVENDGHITRLQIKDITAVPNNVFAELGISQH